MSTWSVRFYDPNQVAGFQLNVWLVVPLCPPVEGRNVFPHPPCPYCVSVWLRSGETLLMVKVFLKLSDGKLAACWPMIKRFGVNASRSRGLELMAVIGLALSDCSTRHSVVLRISSVTLLLPRMSYETRLTLRTNRSQEPPWCSELDGFNFPLIPFWTKTAGASLFQLSMQAKSSFWAPTKFVPLSDMMVVGVPRRAINLSTPITQELVSSEGTTSMCTALVVRQVNKKPHLFSVLLRIGNRNGPK